MRLRVLSIALLVLVAAGVCVRLGLWQLSRLDEKRALNASMRAGLDAPPVALGAGLPPDSAVARRVVEAHGRWDRDREVLVAGGLRREVPVSHLVLPLVLESGEAVLVDRGSLPAEDAAGADLSRYADSARATVRGWAEPMRRGAGPPGPRPLAPAAGAANAARARYSARWLDAESLATRFPYRIGGFVLRELPAAGALPGLEREPPPPLDENVHLGYAVQWFAIAAVVLGGGAVLAARDRRR